MLAYLWAGSLFGVLAAIMSFCVNREKTAFCVAITLASMAFWPVIAVAGACVAVNELFRAIDRARGL